MPNHLSISAFSAHYNYQQHKLQICKTSTSIKEAICHYFLNLLKFVRLFSPQLPNSLLPTPFKRTDLDFLVELFLG